MTRDELQKEFILSDILTKWHWFQYHFNYLIHNQEHPFVKSILDCLLLIGGKIPGIERTYVKRLASYSGKEKYQPHYAQLMQILAELLIIYKAITYEWNFEAKFHFEPKISSNKKNPEINIELSDFIIGIEVKSPTIYNYQRVRTKKDHQIPSRNIVFDLFHEENRDFTPPRDNPIISFLESANEKFKASKLSNDKYISVLYIVWDDFIYEPISILLNEPNGIFSKSNKAKILKNEIPTYPYVDIIMISRHILQFQSYAAEKKYIYEARHLLDYGEHNIFPFKVYIVNPLSEKLMIPQNLIDCFQVYNPLDLLGAEYQPQDFIIWI